MNTIDILILLDRSGSMMAQRPDHEGGLRSFVSDQQQMAGDVRLTFVQFDSENPSDVVVDRTPIRDVRPDDLRLIPRGGTPLLDAVGRTFSTFKARLSHQVVALVITDGGENDSREWTKTQVQALLKECEAAGWKILYLGANVDEFAEAAALGVDRLTASGYAANAAGIHAMYAANSRNLTETRTRSTAGGSWVASSSSMDYSDQDRKDMQGGTA